MTKYTGSKVLTKDGVEAVFLFIAELNSFKEGLPADKVTYGKQCWYESKLHDLDYNKEDDRSEANENIWLERLYDGLDSHFQLKTQLVKKIAAKGNTEAIAKLESNPSETFEWTVPVELDASALTISAH